MKPQFEIEELREPVPGLEAMTFPVYQQLLALAPSTRHPEQGDEQPVQPLAVVARCAGEPVGLALGEVPLAEGDPPELLSVFVAPDWRGLGLATALVARLEAAVAGRGFRALTTVYTAGRPSIAAVEAILAARGWTPPEARTVTVRFDPAAFLATELFEPRRIAALGARLELFPWRDLTEGERERIRASHESSPWITPALAPWRFEKAGFDAVSSVGARYRGEVVGWVINHRVAPDYVRFTCSFMRKDISRRGRIVPLYEAALRALAREGCRRSSFVTPVCYPNMIRFIERWIAPIAEFVGETRGSRKELAP
jgi:GNAT superfamily N-acetyltransferase